MIHRMKQNINPNNIGHFYEFKPDKIITWAKTNKVQQYPELRVRVLGSDPHHVAVSIVIKALWASVPPFVK